MTKVFHHDLLAEMSRYKWVLCLLMLLAQAQAFAQPKASFGAVSPAQQKPAAADSAAIYQLLSEASNAGTTNPQKGMALLKQAAQLARQHQYAKALATAYRMMGDTRALMDNHDSVGVFYQQALGLYQEAGYKRGISQTMASLGYWHFLRGNYASSRQYNQQALQGFQALKDTLCIAQVQSQLGLVAWGEGNYAAALRYFQQSLPYYAWSENNLGLIYLELNQDSLALAHFQKSLAYDQSMGDTLGVSIALGNIGDAYKGMKKDSLALQYYERSLTLSQQLHSLEGIAFCQKSIGSLKIARGKLAEGLQDLEQAEVLYRKIGSKEGLGFCLSMKANVFLEQEKYTLAIGHASESMALARQLQSKQLTAESAKILAQAHKQQKNFEKALAYHELYQQYNDSLNNAGNIRKIEGIRYSYALEKKEVENQQLRNEKELQQAKAQKQFLLLLTIGAGLVLSMLLLMLLWKSSRTKKRSNQLLAQQKEQILLQNEELQATNEMLAELDQEKDSLMSVVAHDLKSPLNRTQALAQLIRLNGPLSKEQLSFLELIEKVSKDGGRLIEDILTLHQAQQTNSAASLSTIVLTTWLDDLLLGYRQQAGAKNIQIHYQPLPSPVLVETNEDALTRILDNLLSNALKFSKTGKNVFISLQQTPAGTLLSIRDEGPGISAEDQKKMFRKFQRLTARPTAGESSTGLGLAIVKSLAKKMGASIAIESELGKGTSFSLLLPQAAQNQQAQALIA